MCIKANTKRFFVLLHHPPPLQKSLPLGVYKQTSLTKEMFESTRNQVFLNKTQLKELGIENHHFRNAYLVPIEIPQDWFIH